MTSITVGAATGIITLTYNQGNVGGLTAATNTLTLTPYINSVAAGIEQLGTALANGNAGPLDWACASVSNATATARGMDAGIVAGTMLAKYAPAECR